MPDKDEAFQPKHLKPDQLKALYAQALEQTEVAVANAWINSLLNQDDVHKTAYTVAAEKLARVEADLARITEAAAKQ